ncbi:MAG: hypothetical protein AAB532_03775 [Patescibacteria group bacterium]
MPYKDILKRREAHKRYYRNNLYKYYIKNIERKKMLAVFVNELKYKPCKDCGIIYPPYVMDFDYIKGQEKLNSVARLIHNGWSKAKLLEEMAKCDLVCANCHRIRTYKRLRMG